MKKKPAPAMYTKKETAPVYAKFARTNVHTNKKIDPIVRESYVRETQKIESKITSGGSTALKPQQFYTGDKMIGVATMHKSSMVPVFRESDAKDIASMRR